jgi:hypothetical protein
VATVDGKAYSRGIQTINYPHIPTQTLFPEASSPLVKLSVSRGKTQSVGYLMGAGDEVPEALRQLGYAVTLLDPSTDLTLERLRRFDAVIVAGGHRPEPEIAAKAEAETIALLGSSLSAFDIAGRLYEMGLRSE